MHDLPAFWYWMASAGALVWLVNVSVKRLFSRDTVPQLFLHTLIGLWACIVIGSQALALANAISSSTVSFALVVVAAVVAVLVRLSRTRVLKQRTRPVFAKPWTLSQQAICLLWFAFIGWGVAFTIAELGFPDAWDSLAYHVPLVNHWLQDGNLLSKGCAFGYVPGNCELLGLWIVAPFSGDFFIGFQGVVPTLVLALTCFQWCRELGIRPFLAHIATLSFLATKPVVRQLITTENDVAVVALFAAVLFYALRWQRTSKLANLLFGAIAFGLLVGIKYYAIGYAVVIILALSAVTLASRKRLRPFKFGVTCIAGAVCLSGYWYLRNTIIHGGPLFPKGILCTTDQWGAMRPESGSLLASGFNDSNIYLSLLNCVYNAEGPTMVVALLLLPMSVLLLASRSFIAKDATRSVRMSVHLLVLLTTTLVVYIVTPNVVEIWPGRRDMLTSGYHSVRFGLCFYLTALVALAFLASNLARGHRAQEPTGSRHKLHLGTLQYTIGCFLALLFFVGACWQIGVHLPLPGVLTEQAAIAISVWIALAVASIWWRDHSAKVCSICWIALLLIGCGTVPAFGFQWHRDFARFYDQRLETSLITQLEHHHRVNDKVCFIGYKYYPAFGSARSRSVERPLWFASADDLRCHLDTYQPDLIVSRTDQEIAEHLYRKVPGWMRQDHDRYDKIYSDFRYTLLRIKND